MRFHVIVLTLTGAAQQLVLNANGRTPLRSLALTAGTANAAPVYVGGSNAVSSTTYGLYIPAAVTSVPAAPLMLPEIQNGAAYLEDYWVIGASNEKLHIGVWVYV